jgi:hypothetical protein
VSNQKRRARPLLSSATQVTLLALAMLAVAPDAALAQQTQQTQQAAPPAASGAPASAPSSGQASGERVNDYPTLARVEYVFECLNDNPGPPHEMLYKCVCAVDRVAEAVPYERWVELSTFFKAQPIAGERGAYVRERPDIQAQLKSYRELQLNAKKACFIPTDRK